MMQALVTHIACDSFALVSFRKEDCDRLDNNKRRNEDNHSRDRSGNQKGRQHKDNWRGQDRGMGADNYGRNASDEGKKLFSAWSVVVTVFTPCFNM
jgi:hypothetical protein